MRTVLRVILISILLCATLVYADSPTDDSIEDSIDSQIILDEFVSELDISVECHNGIVTLIGNVNNTNEANKLIDIAQSTSGVIGVDASQLKIVQPR